MQKAATQIKKFPVNSQGARWIEFALSHPLAEYSYVIVSALDFAFDTGGPETYIFPSDGDGNIIDWAELEGSYRGGTDHAEALRRAGYALAV